MKSRRSDISRVTGHRRPGPALRGLDMSNVITEIGHGLKVAAEDVLKFVEGAGDKFLALVKAGKLVTVAEDGEKIATDGANKIATLLGDSASLATAVAKDDGATLSALASLVAKAATVSAESLANWTDDATLVAAAVAFLQSCKSSNFPDVISAIQKIATDAQAVGTTLEADFKQLAQDAA